MFSSFEGNETEVTKFVLALYLFLSLENTRKTEDYGSCIAHLSAGDMLKSAVIEEKKFKHSPWAGADNPLRPKFLCQWEGLITMVICASLKSSDLMHIFS